MDTLEELPVEQWPILQEKMQKLWPLNIVGYCTLSANTKNREARQAFQFKVYCPFGDMENGFIATCLVGTPRCIICAVTEDTSKLEDALVKTKLIDWSKVFRFNMARSSTSKVVSNLKPLGLFEHYNVESMKVFYLDRSTKPFKNQRCPANTFLGQVKEEHINMINNRWSYKHPGSYLYFATLASYGMSYGLYSSSTKDLITWVFVNEMNGLCNFHCKQNYRKRGYGEFILGYAVNDLLTDGNDAFALVKEDNEKPLSILHSLGFKEVDQSVTSYLYARKNIKCRY